MADDPPPDPEAVARLRELLQDAPTLPYLQQPVHRYVDEKSTAYNLICILFAGANAAIPIHAALCEFTRTNETVLAWYVDPASDEGVASRYGLGRAPTCIVFHNKRELRRFVGPELDQLIPFVDERKPKALYSGTARRLGGTPTTGAPQPEVARPPPPAKPPQKVVAPPQKVENPPQKPTPPPQKAAPPAQKVEPQPERRCPPPTVDPGRVPRPPAQVTVPWASFRKKASPDFTPTPEQIELREELIGLELRAAEVDLALEVTKSSNLDELCDWIATFQEEGELWAEVDWILAGRPRPPPPLTATSAVAAAKPAPAPAARRVGAAPPAAKPEPARPPAPAGPAKVTIKFRLPGKQVEYAFEPSTTVADVIAKLKEADIPPDATVSLMSPCAPPFVDFTKTLTESGLQGRVLLNVQVT